MTIVLKMLLWMAVLTWLTLLAASLLRAQAWTFHGIRLAFGNRDNLPEPSPLAGRAERTARNTLENLVLFTAVVVVTHAAAANSAQAALGAQIFFWSRLLFVPVYYAGIIYLRTAVWLVSIIGLGMMVMAVL